MPISIKLPLLHAPAARKRDAQVFAEQVKSLYELLPMSMAGSTIAGVVIALVMWGHVPSLWLGGWLALLLANQAWRWQLFRSFWRAPHAPPQAPFAMRRWCDLWLIGVGVSGLLLGIAGYAFFDVESVFRQLVLMLVLFVICSGSVPLHASHSSALYLFIPTTMAPLIVRMLRSGEDTHVLLAMVLTISAIFMLVLGRHQCKVVLESLAIRFENLDLIRELSAQKKIRRRGAQSSRDRQSLQDAVLCRR